MPPWPPGTAGQMLPRERGQLRAQATGAHGGLARAAPAEPCASGPPHLGERAHDGRWKLLGSRPPFPSSSGSRCTAPGHPRAAAGTALAAAAPPSLWGGGTGPDLRVRKTRLPALHLTSLRLGCKGRVRDVRSQPTGPPQRLNSGEGRAFLAQGRQRPAGASALQAWAESAPACTPCAPTPGPRPAVQPTCLRGAALLLFPGIFLFIVQLGIYC